MTKSKRPKNPYGPFYGPIKRSEEWDNFSLPNLHRVEVTLEPMPLRSEVAHRSALDDTSPPLPEICFMNSLEHEVTEDIVCRGCTKILIPKGGMSSSAPHTTHYLKGGELAYSCHDCEAPMKLKRPTEMQVRSPRIRTCFTSIA